MLGTLSSLVDEVRLLVSAAVKVDFVSSQGGLQLTNWEIPRHAFLLDGTGGRKSSSVPGGNTVAHALAGTTAAK